MKTVAILSALANGVNPLSGEELPVDSPCHQAEVVRALFTALERIKQATASRSRKSRAGAEAPSNVGKPWTEAEDRRLLAAFDEGKRPQELAQELARTIAGIEARLEKLGRMSALDRTTVNRYSRVGAPDPPK